MNDHYQPEPGEPNYESLDEIAFEVFSVAGAEGVREVFGKAQCSAEALEDCAAALEQAGKPSIASIIMGIAADMPSELDQIGQRFPKGSRQWEIKRNIWFYYRSKQTGEPVNDIRARYEANES